MAGLTVHVCCTVFANHPIKAQANRQSIRLRNYCGAERFDACIFCTFYRSSLVAFLGANSSGTKRQQKYNQKQIAHERAKRHNASNNNRFVLQPPHIQLSASDDDNATDMQGNLDRQVRTCIFLVLSASIHWYTSRIAALPEINSCGGAMVSVLGLNGNIRACGRALPCASMHFRAQAG